jgi:hypothetical protein
MYFADLTPYTYLCTPQDPNTLNVGWLDRAHSFNRAAIPELAVARLLSCCFSPVQQTRGYYGSPFADGYDFGYEVQLDGRAMRLGSAEIRVYSANGRIYAAPNLVYHYVKDVGYLPPREFVEALLSG